jgi:hypothetical protein
MPSYPRVADQMLRILVDPGHAPSPGWTLRRVRGTSEAMRRFLSPAAALFLLLGQPAASAQDEHETAVHDDRADFGSGGQWIYNDLRRGLRLARKSGKPLLVVIRCVP